MPTKTGVHFHLGRGCGGGLYKVLYGEALTTLNRAFYQCLEAVLKGKSEFWELEDGYVMKVT